MMQIENVQTWEKWLQKWFVAFLIIGVAVNLSGLFITILDTDGTLYASIAKTMAQNGDYVNLKVSGKDWLDKPHFPFWMAAFSYKLLGFTSFAYKLPALLFWALGAVYVYLFAKDVYSINIGKIALLIYLSAAHLIVSNNDVRAEPYLTGMIIGSTYHLYKIYQNKKVLQNILLGALLAAFAIMTKGPFVLITIGAGFVCDWILKKDFKQFYNWRWWLLLIFIGIFIFPEIYCLYVQFDLHPEKIVFNKTGVSGVKFFFWDSQFGRFFNSGPIKGEGDYFFFIHTLLWAFLPWCLLFYAALGWRLKHLLKGDTFKTEQVLLFSSLVSLLIFSLSKFQLPYYTNILFPFFAIITAQYVYQLQKPFAIKIHSILQWIVIGAIVLIILLLWYFFRPNQTFGIIAWCLIFAIGFFILHKKKQFVHLFGVTFWTAIAAFAFLNTFFYPALFAYQSGSNAAVYVNENYAGKTVYAIDKAEYSLAFYAKAPVVDISLHDLFASEKPKTAMLIYGSQTSIDSIAKAGYRVTIHQNFPFFHASELTGTFLNYKTRKQALENYVVATMQ